MLRLLKLAIWGVIGYAVYEFIQGVLHESPRGFGDRRNLSGAAREAGAEARQTFESGRPGQNQFSSGGDHHGREEMTNDPAGTSVRHFVGRGVVRNG